MFAKEAATKAEKGLYEVFSMNRTLRSLLLKGASTDELKDAAIKAGCNRKSLSGITTVEQDVTTTASET